MQLLTRIQILEEAVYISLHTNSLGKGMDLSIILPTMVKQKGRLCSLALIKLPVKEKENTEFKTSCTPVENWPCLKT